MERAVHVKRRLTAVEWGDRPWGMDVRHTPEAQRRLEACRPYLPPGYAEMEA